MSTVEQVVRPFVAGERLSRDEFMRRWEEMPHLKRAELIDGVVYLPSPVSVDHGIHESAAGLWVAYYAAFTPGCRTGSNLTWLMLKDSPQPDVALMILSEYGGQSSVEGRYCKGAPELVVEVCVTSRSYDLGPKLRLYRKAGVLEYISVVVDESIVTWRRLVDGNYLEIEPGADGLLRSRVCPGLWLDPRAFLDGNTARVIEVLQQGLKSPEHEEFVDSLAARRAR